MSVLTETHPSAALLSDIASLREGVASCEADLLALELTIPEVGTIGFRAEANQGAIIGTRVQIRMDTEYLTQLRGDLRRLERCAAA